MSAGDPLRVHRIPHSTNVERIALACGHKGLVVAWLDHDPRDRSALRALSGQDLVPVAETPHGPVADSPAILEWLESAHPAPPLLPADPARRAELRAFVDWFNLVWKRAPNELAAEPGPGPERAAALRAVLATHLVRLHDMLTGRPFLFGDELTLADVTVFPFLTYPVLGLPAGDEDPFHAVLAETMRPGLTDRLADWVERVNARPRA